MTGWDAIGDAADDDPVDAGHAAWVPANAFNAMTAFVATNTQFPTITLKAVKPSDAANWPMNSHLDTSSLDPARHCLWICRAMVAMSTSELAQSTTSVSMS